MQVLQTGTKERARVVMFVPRWLELASVHSGLPYRIVPVLSSLLRNGFTIDLFTGVHDEPDGDELRRRLPGAAAAIGWCAELNPGVQLPGLLQFLDTAARVAPDVERVAGGGFFALLPPPRLDLAPLTDAIVAGQEVDSLSRQLTRTEGAPRERFDVAAMHQLDLRPFLRPEAMLFENQEPSLQIPTGLGCSKRCAFCFYEQSTWRALPAADVADLIEHTQERYGVRQYLLGELDFLASTRRALDLAERLAARRDRVRWFALGTVDDFLKLSDDDLRLLERSGCRALELGIEAGTSRALQQLGKRFGPREALEAHRRLARTGILPVYNFVFGWPGERPADRRASRRLIHRIHRTAPRVRFNFRIYQPIPGTTMGEQAMQHLPPLPRNLTEVRSYRTDRAVRLPWLPAAEERRVRFLVEYVLPLAYDDALHAPDHRDPRRTTLRRIARLRSRTGLLDWPLDRKLFERLTTAPLTNTYLP